VIEIVKKIDRNPNGGSPYISFPKQIFDALWGTDDEIPVRIRFVDKTKIVIERVEVQKEVAQTTR